MTTPKLDRTFRSRSIARNVILFIPPAIAFVYMVTHRRERDGSFWFAGAFFLLWIVAWMVSDALRMRRYRCRACGARMKRSAAEDEVGKIVYNCSACGAVWDTGLRESDW
jgi:hypothetical protein